MCAFVPRDGADKQGDKEFTAEKCVVHSSQMETLNKYNSSLRTHYQEHSIKIIGTVMTCCSCNPSILCQLE